MRKMRAPFLMLVLLTLSQAIGAQGPSTRAAAEPPFASKVDGIFADVNNDAAPGAAVVIVRNGKVEYERGYGMADLENGVKITPSTIFHVGSVSKQFTAMAVQMLVTEGKVSLDDDVRKLIPELHNFGKTIRIKNLLDHTSGLREQLQLLFMAGWRLEDVVTQEDILRLVWRQRELNFEPGAEYLYSNTNYTLLALIVERASGKPLSRYAEENIFVPLGMKNTRFREDHRAVTKNLALSYINTARGIRHMLIAGAYTGPAGLMTTAEDLALWDRNFYTAQVGGRETVHRMLATGRLNDGADAGYASGLNVGTYRGLKSVEHSGEDAGYQADILRFPDQKFSVIVLSNLGGFDAVTAARQVAEVYLADEIKAAEKTPLPAKPGIKEVSIPAGSIESLAGEYKLSFGITLGLANEAGKLTARVRNEAKKELIAASLTRFSSADGAVIINFLPPENGKTIRLKIELNGQRLEGERVEHLTVTRPAEYAGTYYSDELRSVYSVTYREEKLFLSHRRGEEPLVIKHEDEFATGFSSEARRWRGGEYARLRFTRDNKKRVSGFLLSMPSARGLRFVKAELPASFFETG